MSQGRIVIDARMCNESGIGRYIRNLIAHLQNIDNKNEYFILHLRNDFEKIKYQDNFHKVLANFSWYGIREQISVLRVLKNLKCDLVHFPHFNIPYFFNGKFIVTIHDLIHQHFSMERSTTHGTLVYKTKQFGYQLVFKKALLESQKILVPSEFVKGQITQDWNVNTDKIIVTPEAVDESVFNLKPKTESENVLKKFNIKTPYLFYVGNAHPHKNVEGLIQAFNLLKVKFPNLLLVLSGNDHYFWQKIKKENQKDQNIIFTGYVSDKELMALYSKATCFVMPSFEEGFGIPLLEAMACSCPVVSSSVGSLPEVGDEAVMYFDPRSIADMAKKISNMLDESKLRKGFIEKGLKRYKEFSWKKLAEQTHSVYLQYL